MTLMEGGWGGGITLRWPLIHMLMYYVFFTEIGIISPKSKNSPIYLPQRLRSEILKNKCRKSIVSFSIAILTLYIGTLRAPKTPKNLVCFFLYLSQKLGFFYIPKRLSSEILNNKCRKSIVSFSIAILKPLWISKNGNPSRSSWERLFGQNKQT